MRLQQNEIYGTEYLNGVIVHHLKILRLNNWQSTVKRWDRTGDGLFLCWRPSPTLYHRANGVKQCNKRIKLMLRHCPFKIWRATFTTIKYIFKLMHTVNRHYWSQLKRISERLITDNVFTFWIIHLRSSNLASIPLRILYC